jgi:hypothetical protein
MEPNIDLAPRCRATMSPLRLWVVSLFFATVSAVLIAALQSASELAATRAQGAHAAMPERAAADRLRLPHAAFTPTFVDAAGSLRARRHAEDKRRTAAP